MLLQSMVINTSWAETKSGYEVEPGFGSPDSVNAQLAEDDSFTIPSFRFPSVDEALKPWFDWKKELNKEHGLKLGTDYTTLYQRANSVDMIPMTISMYWVMPTPGPRLVMSPSC